MAATDRRRAIERVFRLGMAVMVYLSLTSCGMFTQVGTQATDGEFSERSRYWQDFGRTYAVVRHFHPSQAVEETDWNVFLPRLVQDGLNSEQAGSERSIVDLFAPWIRQTQSDVVESNVEQRYWQHTGPGLGSHQGAYKSLRVRAKPGTWEPASMLFNAQATQRIYPVQLNTGAELQIPLVLAADVADTGPAPAQVTLPQEPSETAMVLADIFELWGVLRHFYPYQDQVSVDWNELLAKALNQVLDRPVAAGFAELPEIRRQVMQQILVAIEDGHAWYRDPEPEPRSVAAARLIAVDAGVVVREAQPDSGLQRGDLLLSVDGRDAGAVLQQHLQRYSGSPHRRLYQAMYFLLHRPAGQALPVEVQRDGKVIEVMTPAARPFYDAAWEVPTRLPAGMGYLRLIRLDEAELRKQLPAIQATRSMIFDLRGYPDSGALTLIRLLLRQAEAAQWMQVPRWVEPGGRWHSLREIGWNLQPEQPSLKQRIAFLVDAGAISYSESILGYVEAHCLGAIFGAPSAGANGNVATVNLPGGGQAFFTGMRVTRHDGSLLHGQGIMPTHHVRHTLAGLRAGRDEVLDAAVHWLQSNETLPCSVGATTAGP